MSHKHRIVLTIVCGVITLAGCGKTAPPPPPPPPPPPAPVEADPQVVARHIAPFFGILFDRGFNADVVETPYRHRVVWSDPWVRDSQPDAWNATPTLSQAVAALGMDDASWVEKLRLWAEFPAEQWRRGPDKARISPAEARDVMFALLLQQAIRDADQKNYHRSHVILTDVATTMSQESPLSDRTGRDVFSRFFSEVPDAARFEDFAERLAAYTASREKEVLVGGEHAAVLHAAGLTAAAEFMREQLLSQFDLITFPMIESAIDKGIKYGFRAPTDVVEIRDRLKSLAEALRLGTKPADIDRFRSDAIVTPPDGEYLKLFADFESLWKMPGEAGSNADSGVETQLRELAARPRTVVEWLREKALVARHVPLLTLQNPMTHRFLSLVSPRQYVTAERQFRVKSIPELVIERQNLGAALSGWCRGEPLPDDLADGSAYALLSWHWLEGGRPELAQAALIGGALALLKEARQLPREELEGMGEAAANILAAELNGYRLLVAATEIEAAPPGAARGSGTRYLPELTVLLARWQGTWERCSLPALASDLVVRELESQIQISNLVALLSRESRERYYFNDYRFSGGPVPNVVLERVLKESLFGPDGNVPPDKPEAIWEFFKGFTWPKAFSTGFQARWKTPAAKS